MVPDQFLLPLEPVVKPQTFVCDPQSATMAMTPITQVHISLQVEVRYLKRKKLKQTHAKCILKYILFLSFNPLKEIELVPMWDFSYLQESVKNRDNSAGADSLSLYNIVTFATGWFTNNPEKREG